MTKSPVKLSWQCIEPDCENPKIGGLDVCDSHRRAEKKELRQLSKPIKVTRIKPRTAKRAAQEAKYYKRKPIWLAEHDKCEYAFCRKKSDDIHHMAGRSGDLLLNEELWLALCRGHHAEVTNNSAKAIADGYSISRNQKTEI